MGQRLAVKWEQVLWKGLNGWDSDDVWDLNGIHLLTAGATLAQKDNEMECHAGAQVKAPSGRQLESDFYAEQVQRVPRDGRRRGELGAQRQQDAKPVPFDAWVDSSVG